MNFLEKFNVDLSKLDFFQKIIGVNILIFIVYRLTFLFRFQNDFISYFSLEADFLSKPCKNKHVRNISPLKCFKPQVT